MLTPLIQKLESRFVLSDADRIALQWASAHVQRIAPRTDLIQEGNTPDHVYLIQSGFACRYKTLPDGNRSIIAYLIPGDICDLNVSILGAMDHSIATLSVCNVVRIPRQIVDEVRTAHPTLNRALQWVGLVDEAILRQWLVSMGRRPAAQQVAHLLCELLVRLRTIGLANGDSYELPFTQSDVADSTGLSSVHVNRTLQEFCRKGLILLKGKILRILNVEELKALANFNPSYLRLKS